jgi:hypothetical protein
MTAVLTAAACAGEYTPPDAAQALRALTEMTGRALQSGIRAQAWLEVLGPGQQVELVKADEKQLAVRLQGNVLPVAWAKMKPEQIAGVGKACMGTNGASALCVVDYCIATQQYDQADKLLNKAFEIDAALGPETSARWAFLKARKGEPVPSASATTKNGDTPRTPPTADRAAALRELTDFTLDGMHRRLGPDYAFYHKSEQEKLPAIWMPPTKEGAKGRRYQIGGPWAKEAGDYSSTQGQILYVPDSGCGVDRVTIIEMSNNCFTEKPEPPWWGGFRPEPASKHWQQAAGGNPGFAVGMARGMANWSNCGVIVFSSGLIATAGTCTGKGSDPVCQLPRGKIPTAISVTNKNEFALISVYDSEKRQGQIAVVALESSAKKTGFAHEWKDDYPCLPNVAVFTRLKLLGFVDLPGITAPTGISAVGEATTNRLNGASGHQTTLREFDLSQAGSRQSFGSGNNAGYVSSCGFAVVSAKHEGKVAFLDLQPLFQRVRDMYFTTDEPFKKTRDLGPDPKQWPCTFESDPTWKPVVVAVLDQPQPTAVLASLGGGKHARAFVASQDGRIGIYQVGGLATDAPAVAAEIRCVGTVQVGRNPVCLAYQKHSGDTFIAVSRGDRELAWVKYSEKGAEVTRRLRDARLLDPVHVEVADTHGISAAILTVADFKGRKIVNYRYSELVFATQGGARFGMGEDGKADFECGGVLEFPGSPFCISATNVN